MTYEELKSLIIQNRDSIKTIDERWNNLNISTKIHEFHCIKNSEEFWKQNNQTEILKEAKKYESLQERYDNINNQQKNLEELIDLYHDDESEIKNISNECFSLIKETKKLTIELLMNHEDDSKNCFFDINAGAGGTEAQDWAAMILRMYIRFFEDNKLSYDLMDYQAGEEAGIKSATLFVRGDYPVGFLNSEVGIHRLVRISPFDSNKRRHTSFAAVSLTPEVPDIQITIDPKDLRIDTYRAGGAGGQHVNKTDSAVRITHIPTNIVVQCQNERSQLQNKDVAMKALKAKLYQYEKHLQDIKNNTIEKKKIEWGSQIRSYVLHPYKMVKDHRTEHESSQPEKILDGDLMLFIEQFLIQRQ
jgi:peptide chain release factor 2